MKNVFKPCLFSFAVITLIIGMIMLINTGDSVGTLTGVIRDKSTHTPIAGAVVRIFGTSDSVVTSASGCFVLAPLNAGFYHVVVTASGYQSVKIENIEIQLDAETNIEPLMAKTLIKTDPIKVLTSKDIHYGIKKNSSDKDELQAILKESMVDRVNNGETGTLTGHGGAAGKAASAAKSAAGRGMMAIAGGYGSAGGGAAVNLGSLGYLNPPNGAKYWDMYHTDYGTNPFIDTEDDNLSTFGADVSTGSYTLCRNYLNHNDLPPKDAVRVEEFINYFKTSYAAPENETFAVYTESAASPLSKNCQLVKIGIKGKSVKSENRKPAQLTFVIDVSGSMNIENRLGLVKKTMLILNKNLNENDKVGIVTYGTNAQVVLEPTSNKEAIENAVQGLYSNGSTNAEAGLWTGYKMAADHYNDRAINRVILCTDGVANNGETSSQGLLSMIEKFKNKGITLTACGFGMGNYNDVLIEQLATKGDGTYYYIDDLNEAKRVFLEQLTGTLQTIAKDVKIQVEFDKDVVSRYRLIGYEKRDIKDEDFRNDKIDAGEIGADHTVTAMYEVKLKNPNAQNIGTITLRYKSPDGKRLDEMSRPVALTRTSSQELQFLSAVVLYAEIMKESYWTKHRALSEVKALLDAMDSKLIRSNEQYQDFDDMVRMTMKLKANKELGYLKTDKDN